MMGEDRLDSGGVWREPTGEAGDVVLSSRVRLARNLAGFNFLSSASRDDRRQILSIAHTRLSGSRIAPPAAVGQASVAASLRWVSLAQTPELDRRLLVERRLISKQHAKGDEPRAVLISEPDERLAIMVNEEDHLRIQVMRSGMDLEDAYTQIQAVDDRIEAQVEYAFCPRFGYLTACPTNVGTGIRVSAMLHLPALKHIGEIDKVRRAAKSLNLAVRGYYGEGSEAIGDIYQLSNQTTLGKTERDILTGFATDVMPKVIEYERHARRRLLENRRRVTEDRVHRALGTLGHARLLNADEAIKLLSQVRLGVALGMIAQPDMATISELMLLTQPAHLQRAIGMDLNQAQRRHARATLVRERLESAPSNE